MKFAIGLLLMGFWGCGLQTPCTAENCPGCCGQDQRCEAGNTPDACGTGGALCVQCPGAQVCSTTGTTAGRCEAQ